MHTMSVANILENLSSMICFFIYWMSAAVVTSEKKNLGLNRAYSFLSELGTLMAV